MLITKTSMLTGNLTTREVNIHPKEYEVYMEGNLLIQDLFKHLSADDREFLISGITPEEWEARFGDLGMELGD